MGRALKGSVNLLTWPREAAHEPVPDGNTVPLARRLERLDTEQDREGAGGITPLESNALGLRDAALWPEPAFADVCPWPEKTQTELIDPPSVLERRLRLRMAR